MGAMSNVVVVGAGPAGSSAAFWLAKAGVDVTLVEKKSFPREKTCGDGLTPRAIYELQLMGYNFDFERPGLHRVTGLRSYGGPELKLEMQWPDHSKFPNWGAIVRRRDLDHDVVKLAVTAGAKLHEKTTAEPVVDGGQVTHVDLIKDGERERIAADYVVIADGTLSRFGRVLGTSRRRDYPMGLAARGYFDSPRSTDPFMESQLYITDATGAAMPGYGWIFPLGDGTVNVGVGLLSTFKRWKDVNTTDMMHAYSGSAPSEWELTNPTPHRGGKLSMALSVGPKAGPNWIAVGDAAGAINPWNGEGISYAYETGRIAAGFVIDAIKTNSPGHLMAYPDFLEEEYGDYYRFARLFVKAIGQPWIMSTLTKTGLRSKPLMEWVLKVMANLLEEEEKKTAEHAYYMLERLVRMAPGRLVAR